MVGVARSLSEHTLALIAPPIHDLLVTLLGIWAQTLLLLLAYVATARKTASVLDDGEEDQMRDEYVDANAELQLGVDNTAAPTHV